MTTVRDIVARALRMLGWRKGRDPRPAELADGLIALQGLYDAWFTGGMFGRLADYYTEDDYEAAVGQRVFATSGTVTLPELVEDEHPPRDLSAIEVNDGDGRRAYIWDRQAWVRIDALADSSDAPLANRGSEGLAASLAVWIAEEYGETPGPVTASKAAAFKTNLRLRYGTQQEPIAGQWF